jgi:hypothetical protein
VEDDGTEVEAEGEGEALEAKALSQNIMLLAQGKRELESCSSAGVDASSSLAESAWKKHMLVASIQQVAHAATVALPESTIRRGSIFRKCS